MGHCADEFAVLDNGGSEPTAAGGREREVSEWQRSIKSREGVSPKILSSTATGEPLTCVSSRGQINFVFFCGFYACFRVKGRYWHTVAAIPNLT